MDHSGILLGQDAKAFATPEGGPLAVSARKFCFDAETLRGNHQWVTVTAEDESGHTSLFVIAREQGSDGGEGSDYQACQFRAHGTSGQTEVIVGLLPRAPMRALVKAILDPAKPGITLDISPCA